MNPMQPSAQSLVKGLTKVASLPSIYFKVEEALADPKTSNKLLADIISEDTSLTGRILRLANSAFFNFPGKVDSLTQAIIVVGTHQLRDVVLASSVVSAFKDIPEDVVSMDSFWRHSVACGVVCRILATLRRDPNIETAFVSGLLHDIGRLVLYKSASGEMAQLIGKCRASSTLLYQAENELLGFDHAVLGGMLLQEWRLPRRHADTTCYHHAPHKAREFAAEAAMVHVADIIANTMIEGSSGEHLVPALNTRAWDLLKLDPANIEFITSELNNQYAVAVDFVLAT